jgi:hypothetical protein
MKRVLILAAAVATASSVGCANARYVQKMGDEGIVAIPNNTDAWPSYNRTEACRLIEQHVGPNYEIVEEKEVVTGTATTNNQNTNRKATFNTDVPFLPAEKQTTTTTTTSRNLTEYQIHYRKKPGGPTGFPGTPVAPAGGAAPAGGVVPAMHTEPHAAAPAAQPGGLPPPDMTGLGGR